VPAVYIAMGSCSATDSVEQMYHRDFITGRMIDFLSCSSTERSSSFFSLSWPHQLDRHPAKTDWRHFCVELRQTFYRTVFESS